jgi:hypothetical protein
MPTAVAIPLALTVATPVLLEVHVAEPDTLPVVLSEKLPVAVKVVVVPAAADGVRGATEIPVRVAPVTVTLSGAEVMTLYALTFMAAVTVAAPTALPVTTPVLGPTLAVLGAADVHVTKVVISAVVPFE